MGIRAYPNYGSTGTVRLSGEVADPAARKVLENAAQKVGGFKKIQNDIGVNKDSALTASQVDSIVKASASLR